MCELRAAVLALAGRSPYLTTTVTVWDRDQKLARRKLLDVKQAIQSHGFIVREETMNWHAWLGSLPGNVYANVRRPIVHTVNLAHMMPVSSVWAGDPENEHLRRICGVGAPHVYCSTTGNTPFRLNLNVGDVGHTLVIGPTGAGKSTLIGMFALSWLKYPDARVVIFDKDRSARAATLGVGGACYEPGAEDAPVGFQPLARIDTDDERAWASEFLVGLLASQSMPVTPELRAAVDQTLHTLANDSNPKNRTLTVYANLLRSHHKALGETLRPYTVGGNYGSIFDADHDTVTPSFWTMFEMGHLMGLGPHVVVPALQYLFHRVEAQFDGRPTLLIVDEVWLFLGHPVFASRLQAWLKTLRKSNVTFASCTSQIMSTCSVHADGTLWCNAPFAQGPGGNPTQIGTDASWKSASGGQDHYCAIRTDGSMWCGGFNGQGALGSGTTSPVGAPVTSTPVAVAGGGTDWVEVSVGSTSTTQYSCGVRGSGDLYCWGGFDWFGELGDGQAWSASPVPVTP
jgi:type IV secretory pathway VirB4 component